MKRPMLNDCCRGYKTARWASVQDVTREAE
jgi:hypothetical protein